jgi:hypothetical protein
MPKELIQPDSLLKTADGRVGVGRICNDGIGGLQLELVTPDGISKINSDDAKQHAGSISSTLADWLKQNYRVNLEAVNPSRFLVKDPFWRIDSHSNLKEHHERLA